MKRTKYFESQQENENVLFLIRRHWFVLVGPLIGTFIFYFMAVLGVLVLPFVMPSLVRDLSYNVYVLAISILILLPTTYLFQVFVLYYLNAVIITTEHLVEIQQDRLFARSISVLEFGKVQDVSSKEHGFFQSILNFGTIEVQTAGENRNFIFTNMPRPSDYAQKIMDLEQEYRGRRKTHPSSLRPMTETPLANDGQNANIKKENVETSEAEAPSQENE